MKDVAYHQQQLLIMQIIQSIQNRIYEIRGERVMIDRDLSKLYETETKRVTEAVKRNAKRFPPDFMFQLTKAEWDALRPKMEAIEASDSSRSQIATLKSGQGFRYSSRTDLLLMFL